ncbi:SpoIID/LytB domain-containing protein [Reinekea thalattae]|uniref:SpoIID/LytB domain-containing protein n=1 Tax=Reinekea thalattae TaxID=2593301 RepID=A0A5C8ZB00_9GAMM|nr:SpoIID/LytB domain-containing protein [Reinekea thalattae]TXR53980.1 SpoIID/LytB domain-containing protein [Reinekea thalattae]
MIALVARCRATANKKRMLSCSKLLAGFLLLQTLCINAIADLTLNDQGIEEQVIEELSTDNQIEVMILSKFHPQQVVIETQSRLFEFGPNQVKNFQFSEQLNQPISITVNGVETRYYRGAIQLQWQGSEYRIINTTPLEIYVAGVVVGELGAHASRELVKAQAIIARTYALKKSQSVRLSDLAYHQVFHGFNHYAEAVYSVSRQTQHQVLKTEGRLTEALFHGECGSKIFSAAQFFDSGDFFTALDLPTQMQQGQRWQVRLNAAQLAKVFTTASAVSLQPGTPTKVVVDNQAFAAETFRLMVNREYDWNTIPSNDFKITKIAGGWQLEGFGRGHLVGLCQQQANALAKQGWSASQLLALFYPMASIELYDR